MYTDIQMMTRDQIIDAGMKVFLSKAPKNATSVDICMTFAHYIEFCKSEWEKDRIRHEEWIRTRR